MCTVNLFKCFIFQVDQSKVVLSPMPGLVKSIACAPGDMVGEGQEVCVIGEYMWSRVVP